MEDILLYVFGTILIVVVAAFLFINGKKGVKAEKKLQDRRKSNKNGSD